MWPHSSTLVGMITAGSFGPHSLPRNRMPDRGGSERRFRHQAQLRPSWVCMGIFRSRRRGNNNND